jgi:hypothetical protein
VANQKDPGWLPSLRGLWWFLIPIVNVRRMSGRRTKESALIVLRTVVLGIVASLFLFLWAMSFITPWDGGDERWVPWAVVVIGVVSLAYIARIRRRPLPTTSPEALARHYRALVFVGLGVAADAAMLGLAGVFQGGSLWIYLVGLAFGLVGLWMIAPTRSDIERRQREITAAGSPLSLQDALTTVPMS